MCTPCHASSFPVGYVNTWIRYSTSYGGEARKVKGKHVGYSGKRWQKPQNSWVGLVLGLSKFLTSLSPADELAISWWSQVPRVLKAKYFPSCVFLEGNLGNSPSDIWRSILHCWEVLQQGLIRRIGDAKSAPLWNCNLIPRYHSMRPIVCLGNNLPFMVHDIMEGSHAQIYC
jgi:hypothetical protein